VHKDKSWLSQVENGKIDITFTQLIAIGEVLNVKPFLLFEQFSNSVFLSQSVEMDAGKEAMGNDIALLMKEILITLKTGSQ